MSTWNPDILSDLTRTADLYVSPLRRDGHTHRTPTRIWSVVVDGDLYARAYHGPQARWYRSALTQRAGRIRVGRRTLDVTFAPADTSLTPAIDAAYRSKYGRNSYLDPMLSADAQAATVTIAPCDSGARPSRFCARLRVWTGPVNG